MHAIILAAGQGTRLRPLTSEIPKTLVDLNGRPILGWILDALPNNISEITIVCGYKGEKIEKRIGTSFQGKKITYIHQKTLNGTANALWCAKKLIKTQKFLALHGDNIYQKSDLEQMIKLPLALGVYPEIRPSLKIVFETNDNYNLTGSHSPTAKELSYPLNICAGSYVLDCRIFNEQPIQLDNGEFGLPQTILKFTTHSPVKLFKHSKWFEINTLDDLALAREQLQK
jgi:NDP-sugar pyrophosphorylase family protein